MDGELLFLVLGDSYDDVHLYIKLFLKSKLECLGYKSWVEWHMGLLFPEPYYLAFPFFIDAIQDHPIKLLQSQFCCLQPKNANWFKWLWKVITSSKVDIDNFLEKFCYEEKWTGS